MNHPAFPEAWAQFLRTSDLSCLTPVTHEGARLTVFDIRPLTRKEQLRVASCDAAIEKLCESVAFGLLRVHDLEVDGQPFVLEREKRDGTERVSPKSLDAMFDLGLFAAVGGRIIEISQLDPTNG